MSVAEIFQRALYISVSETARCLGASAGDDRYGGNMFTVLKTAFGTVIELSFGPGREPSGLMMGGK